MLSNFLYRTYSSYPTTVNAALNPGTYYVRRFLFIHGLVVFVVFAVTVLLSARLRTGLAISVRSRHRVTRQLVTYFIGFSVADAVALVSNPRFR